MVIVTFGIPAMSMIFRQSVHAVCDNYYFRDAKLLTRYGILYDIYHIG